MPISKDMPGSDEYFDQVNQIQTSVSFAAVTVFLANSVFLYIRLYFQNLTE